MIAAMADRMRERTTVLTESRQILETAERAGRDLTTTESQRFHELHDRADKLADQIENGKRQVRAEQADLQEFADKRHRERESDVDGDTRVLRPDQSYRSWVAARGLGGSDPQVNRLSVGHLMRAAVTGARSENEERAMSEGTTTAGGFTVPDLVSANFIDALRAQAMVFRAGATTVPLLSNKTTVARVAAAPAVGWHAENASETPVNATLAGPQFDAETLIVVVQASRELIDDSLNIEQMLTRSISGAMAAELDRAAMFGTGSTPEPAGLTTYGINTVDQGTNGSAITNFDEILDAIQLMEEDGAMDPTALILSPREGTTIAKFADSTNQPMQRPPKIERLPFYVSSAVPIDETKGTSSDASKMVLGYWPELWIGVRSELRIDVLRERYADAHQIGFVAHLRADILPAHVESFAMIDGVIP